MCFCIASSALCWFALSNLVDVTCLKRYVVSETLCTVEFGIFLDGTIHDGEAIDVVAIYVDENLKIYQRLIIFATAEKSVTGEQFAGLLIDLLCRQLRIPATVLPSITWP